jgi:hypothetical protein
LVDRSIVPLALVVLVALLGALWLQRDDRRRRLQPAELARLRDTLDVWLLVCAFAAIAAATWAASQHAPPPW